MRKFTAIALGGLPMGVDDLMAMVSSVLDSVFAFRLANELLGWCMEWVPFQGYVKVRRGKIAFDQDRFVMAYLQKNRRWNDRTMFETKVAEARSLLPHDTGRRLRGHDLCELLLPVVRSLRKERKFGNTETLEGCLMATIECRDLEHMPLFQRILALAREG
jgi:hypothetical protein